MEFQVRRAQFGDEPALKALRVEALTDAPEAFGSTLERELARAPEDWQAWLSRGATFFLEANYKAFGLVAVVPDRDDESVVHLMSMWVHSDFRGAGGADLLVSSVKSWAAEMGASQVCLRVIENNSRAERFYRRMGFRPTGRRYVRERDGMIEIEMTCGNGRFKNLSS
jgi:GNAT superfamily N-acetyltransferase